MNWFNDEFYQLADELAAELERLKARWGEEIARTRLRLFRFRAYAGAADAANLRIDYGPSPLYGVPPGAVVQSVSLKAYVAADGWRRWDEVDFWPGAGRYIDVTVEGDGEPLLPAEDAIREVINRPGWVMGSTNALIDDYYYEGWQDDAFE